jgi:hypothetical protein
MSPRNTYNDDFDCDERDNDELHASSGCLGEWESSFLQSAVAEDPHLMEKLPEHRLHLSRIRYLVVYCARPGLDF